MKKWHSDISAMVDDSTLAFTYTCRGHVCLVWIERKDSALRCSVHSDCDVHSGCDAFLRVMLDFKSVCDHMDDVKEVRVKVMKGYGRDAFAQAWRETQETFLHHRERAGTDSSVYKMIGGHRGARPDDNASQTYAKLGKSEYTMLSHAATPPYSIGRTKELQRPFDDARGSCVSVRRFIGQVHAWLRAC